MIPPRRHRCAQVRAGQAIRHRGPPAAENLPRARRRAAGTGPATASLNTRAPRHHGRGRRNAPDWRRAAAPAQPGECREPRPPAHPVAGLRPVGAPQSFESAGDASRYAPDVAQRRRLPECRQAGEICTSSRAALEGPPASRAASGRATSQSWQIPSTPRRTRRARPGDRQCAQTRPPGAARLSRRGRPADGLQWPRRH